MCRLTERWQAALDHPLVRLELRRIRRKRWWPGRRFFMLYPALLGAALGYGVILALSDSPEVQLAALVTGVPAVCLLNVVTALLAFAVPWIAPALTAAAIVHERELGTFDLLRATLLSERSIVLGKLGGCLARLWPGILTLALLMPFYVVWAAGGGFFNSLSYLSVLTMDPASDADLPWVWLLMTGVAGSLRPWGNLALHAAVGLFVSTLSRSSGVAIAVSYAAIIVVRVALSLATSLLGVALATILDVASYMSDAMLDGVWMMPALASLGMVLVEFAGASLLVWGAIRWLKRT